MVEPGITVSPWDHTLNPEEESRFRAWASQNGIRDVDLPDSRYDYRGFWKQNPGFRHRQGEHFVDTFKQHGHPTFSEEPQCSSGPGDGGTWNDEQFIPSGGRVMADPPGSKFQTLQELQRRQQAILGGLQGQAMYPDIGDGTEQHDHDGIVETSDALPSNVGDFSQARVSPEKQRRMAELDQAAKQSSVAPKADDYLPVTSNEYEYKPEYQGSPGALPGRHAGPMAQDLEHIPGVVEQGHDGMKRVRTDRLSLSNASATGENAREIETLKKRLAALEGGLGGSADDTLKNAQSGRY